MTWIILAAERPGGPGRMVMKGWQDLGCGGKNMDFQADVG